MYNDLNDTFNYVVVNEHDLCYRGFYEGDTMFVDGYEEDTDIEISKLINIPSNNWDDSKGVTTPLKTIMLGEKIFAKFDSDIAEGRNLQSSDFKLASSTEPISIVLGSGYQEVYNIGDIISLELISKEMNFEVVGFYKPESGFSMGVGAENYMDFDRRIVMPFFVPEYEPVGEAEIFQHAFLISELTSGYVHIAEDYEEIGDATFNYYSGMVEGLAEKNDLSGLYRYPHRPLGFVW